MVAMVAMRSMGVFSKSTLVDDAKGFWGVWEVNGRKLIAIQKVRKKKASKWFS
jgi:hypothetical protein